MAGGQLQNRIVSTGAHRRIRLVVQNVRPSQKRLAGVVVTQQTDSSIAFGYGGSQMDFEENRSDVATTARACPREGDYATIPASRRISRAGLWVVQYPGTLPVDWGADLPRDVAEAYALDLAEQAGALAWDLTGTLPRKLVASPDAWPANEHVITPTARVE
jgi:hypothetical protein